MVILIILSNARNISDDGDTELLQKLWISDTRALKDLWRAERTSGNDDELSRLDDFVHGLGERDGRLVLFVGLVLDSDGFWRRRFVKEDSDDFRLEEEVEVGVLAILKKRMDVAMSGVLSLAIRTNIAVPFLFLSVIFLPQTI